MHRDELCEPLETQTIYVYHAQRRIMRANRDTNHICVSCTELNLVSWKTNNVPKINNLISKIYRTFQEKKVRTNEQNIVHKNKKPTDFMIRNADFFVCLEFIRIEDSLETSWEIVKFTLSHCCCKWTIQLSTAPTVSQSPWQPLVINTTTAAIVSQSPWQLLVINTTTAAIVSQSPWQLLMFNCISKVYVILLRF